MKNQRMSHGGPERRRHRMIITRNTEYHLRDDLCVAVRDRQSQTFFEGHLAVGRRLEGAVRFHDNGAVVPCVGDPLTGDAIFFSYRNKAGDERQLVTSRIERVGRPAKRDVDRYTRPD